MATEKIHGAHLAIVCEDASVRPAKRRALLTDAELDSFFGLARIWPDLAVAAAETARHLRATEEFDGTLVLYGELAGGHYPHPEVPPACHDQAVQTGVWYCPGLVWLLFDAACETADGLVWLADDTVREAAGRAGLCCAPRIAEGTPTALRELPLEFPSLLPALFALPPLTDNLAEGVVLKPAGRWTTKDSGQRPLLKYKHPRFAEDERYQGARPWTPSTEGVAGVPGWLVAEAAQRLTPARAAAVLSKLGPAAAAGPLATAIAADLLDDLDEDLGGLEPEHRTALATVLAKGAQTLARLEHAHRRAAVRVPDQG